MNLPGITKVYTFGPLEKQKKGAAFSYLGTEKTTVR